MPSREFAELDAAVGDLKVGLMGYSQRVDGAYTKEELMKCQAFIVFSHAEVENYLEKVARRIMREAESRWSSSYLPDRVIAGLLTYRRNEITSPPEDIRNPSKKQNLKEIVKAAMVMQSEAITDNNGIKTSNLSKMLAPLGVSDQEIDETLQIQLSNIGSRRGDFVHQQGKVAVRRLRDPFADEMSDIAALLRELERFDARLESAGLLSPSVQPTGVVGAGQQASASSQSAVAGPSN